MAAARSTFRESVRSLLREQLLDAASESLVAGGWNQLKMADVARAVGVSRQTVYNEFGNKTQLGEALAMREAERFLDGIATTLDEHPDDLLTAITAAVEFTLSEAEVNPLLKAILTATRGGATELLPFVTTRSGPILAAATRVLLTYLNDHWPEIELDEAERTLVVESIVRLVVSHLVMPLAPATEVARQISWLASRILHHPTPEA
ncbi:TetR/AcrR family transcriptional regulator [Haloechinothrix halophila]|uniref:TetR/AcrR family transcriptional regulator n=1 Tax=Haloechinothrix halophila TaxID=1069073 RepID=UPI00068465EE|nr:TetR family transcriptional regulator [Haloechinothrix halophila]